MSAELLLSKLHRVKRVGPGKWCASCPTREDKSPSLSIRELDDGTVLLHDFGGDSVEAILGAVGMTFNDLYPAKPGHFSRPVRRPFNPGDLLELVAFEATVAVLVVSDVVKGKATEADRNRLLVAAQRLGNAAEVCRGRY
jgi:hypothetical protein